MIFNWLRHSKKRIFERQGRVVFLRPKPPGKWRARFLRLRKLDKANLIPFSGVLVIFLIFYAISAGGFEMYFYPTNCSGSWYNLIAATGRPEVDFGSEGDQYSLNNSAFFPGGAQQITCQSFRGESVQSDFPITKATVSFSVGLNFKDPSLAEVVSVSSSEAAVPSNQSDFEFVFENPELASSTDSATSSTQVEPINVEAIEVPDATSSSEVLPPIIIEPEASSTPVTETSSSQSFLSFIKIAYAQEVPVGEQPASTSALGEASSVLDLESTPEAPVFTQELFTSDEPASSGSAVGPATSSISEEPTIPAPDYGQIFYSFDGNRWIHLGSITKENWQNLNFNIPISPPTPAEDKYSVTDSKRSVQYWEDVQRIQFRIESNVYYLEEGFSMYLDSMELALTYQRGNPPENHSLPGESQAEVKKRLEAGVGAEVILAPQFKSGPWIAYKVPKVDQAEIFLRNDATGETKQLTDTPYTESEPVIGYGVVAWAYATGNEGSARGEIVIYDIATGVATQVTHDELVDQLPRFDGNGLLVWDKIDNNGAFHSFTYDFTTQKVQQLDSAPVDLTGPVAEPVPELPSEVPAVEEVVPANPTEASSVNPTE